MIPGFSVVFGTATVRKRCLSARCFTYVPFFIRVYSCAFVANTFQRKSWEIDPISIALGIGKTLRARM